MRIRTSPVADDSPEARDREMLATVRRRSRWARLTRRRSAQTGPRRQG